MKIWGIDLGRNDLHKLYSARMVSVTKDSIQGKGIHVRYEPMIPVKLSKHPVEAIRQVCHNEINRSIAAAWEDSEGNCVLAGVHDSLEMSHPDILFGPPFKCTWKRGQGQVYELKKEFERLQASEVDPLLRFSNLEEDVEVIIRKQYQEETGSSKALLLRAMVAHAACLSGKCVDCRRQRKIVIVDPKANIDDMIRHKQTFQQSYQMFLKRKRSLLY